MHPVRAETNSDLFQTTSDYKRRGSREKAFSLTGPYSKHRQYSFGMDPEQ